VAVEYEDRLRIETPEGVELELILAGIGSRSIAGACDLAIQAAVLTGAGLLLGALDAAGPIVLPVLGFLVIFAYDVAFEVLAGGRTPGKRVTGLRVVRAEGQPVGFVTSAIRNVMRILDILPFLYGVGMLVVFLTRRNQRLGDLAANTLVVRERHGRVATAAAAATAAPVGWDVSGVSAEDVAVVRGFLARRDGLSAPARAQLATDLDARLRPRVAGAPGGLAPEDFLEGLAAAKAARA